MKKKNVYIVHEEIPSEFRFNAGSKARDDIETIIQKMDGNVFFIDNSEVSGREKHSFFYKLKEHKAVLESWKKQLKNLPYKCTVIFQYPVFFHTIYFNKVIDYLHNKGCQVVGIFHDLETLRLAANKDCNKQIIIKRLIFEERRSVPYFDKVIVHNDSMKKKTIEIFSLEQNKVSVIEIFDYLIPNYHISGIKNDNRTKGFYSIIIAGNLNSRKSGYVYKLPDDCKFELYGPNYNGKQSESIHYNGSFLPDELPFILNGDFGLVWDGPDSTNCSRPTGEYLKYNNPHNTSLYLACGIPVIIWKEAAMAKFINDHECGITVDSLYELKSVLNSITMDEYENMRINAEQIGKKLRNGEYTQRAIMGER